jgi:hypothetical protein
MTHNIQSSIERVRLANLAYIANGQKRAEQGQQVTRVKIKWLQDFLLELKKLKKIPSLSLDMLQPQPPKQQEEESDELEVPTLDLEEAIKILPPYLQVSNPAINNATLVPYFIEDDPICPCSFNIMM